MTLLLECHINVILVITTSSFSLLYGYTKLTGLINKFVGKIAGCRGDSGHDRGAFGDAVWLGCGLAGQLDGFRAGAWPIDVRLHEGNLSPRASILRIHVSKKVLSEWYPVRTVLRDVEWRYRNLGEASMPRIWHQVSIRYLSSNESSRQIH